jgi:hypothetical protein
MSYLKSVPGLLALAGLVGCGSSTQHIRMASSPDIPAAQGTLQARETGNGNTALEVDVRHLAPPERVTPGATTYVVWVRNDANNEVQNVGALRVDANLDGSLKTTTPLRSFHVFITAETVPTATVPRGQELLLANVSRKRD